MIDKGKLIKKLIGMGFELHREDSLCLLMLNRHNGIAYKLANDGRLYLYHMGLPSEIASETLLKLIEIWNEDGNREAIGYCVAFMGKTGEEKDRDGFDYYGDIFYGTDTCQSYGQEVVFADCEADEQENKQGKAFETPSYITNVCDRLYTDEIIDRLWGYCKKVIDYWIPISDGVTLSEVYEESLNEIGIGSISLSDATDVYKALENFNYGSTFLEEWVECGGGRVNRNDITMYRLGERIKEYIKEFVR